MARPTLVQRREIQRGLNRAFGETGFLQPLFHADYDHDPAEFDVIEHYRYQHPRMEVGQGDGASYTHALALRFDHDRFVQITRQIALDFSRLDHHIRSQVIYLEERRHRIGLLQAGLTCIITTIASILICGFLFCITPASVALFPFIPSYAIVLMTHCGLDRLFWKYQKKRIIRKRMQALQPEKDRIRIEQARVNRMVDNLFYR